MTVTVTVTITNTDIDDGFITSQKKPTPQSSYPLGQGPQHRGNSTDANGADWLALIMFGDDYIP